MPSEIQQWIGWAQTKESQGLCPRKTMVSLWFAHGTCKMMMIEIRTRKWRTRVTEVNGEDVRGKFGSEPSKETIERAWAMFYKAP